MLLGDHMVGGVTRSMDGGTLGAWGGEGVLEGVGQLLLLLLLVQHLPLLMGALLERERGLRWREGEIELGDWRLQ